MLGTRLYCLMADNCLRSGLFRFLAALSGISIIPLLVSVGSGNIGCQVGEIPPKSGGLDSLRVNLVVATSQTHTKLQYNVPRDQPQLLCCQTAFPHTPRRYRSSHSHCQPSPTPWNPAWQVSWACIASWLIYLLVYTMCAIYCTRVYDIHRYINVYTRTYSVYVHVRVYVLHCMLVQCI